MPQFVGGCQELEEKKRRRKKKHCAVNSNPVNDEQVDHVFSGSLIFDEQRPRRAFWPREHEPKDISMSSVKMSTGLVTDKTNMWANMSAQDYIV